MNLRTPFALRQVPPVSVGATRHHKLELSVVFPEESVIACTSDVFRAQPHIRTGAGCRDMGVVADTEEELWGVVPPVAHCTPSINRLVCFDTDR